jgi:hypothetical protein
MIRRTVVVMATVGVSLLVIPVGVASARLLARSDPVGTGVTTCASHWTGTLTFRPNLINAGASTSEEITIKAEAKTCTGGIPTPTKGLINGKGVILGPGANNCATAFAGGGTFPFSTPGYVEAIKWDPTSISASTALFPSVTESNTADPPYVNLLFNAGTVTGSYSPYATTQSLTSVKKLAIITGATAGNCGSTGGLHTLAIRGPLSTGSF